MTNKINNEFILKLIGTLFYFLLNIACLPYFLSLFPRDLLFNENSKEEKIRLILYKNFAKDVYENINTPLIKNLTITKDNESCPHNFETLIIKNQYFGNFSKFFGNKSFCIERFKNEEYTYKNLIKASNYNFLKKNKKKCGKLLRDSEIYIYVEENEICPLNNIEINIKSRANNFGRFFYQMTSGDHYLIPIYGNNPIDSAIINIDFINNYKVCLEKYNVRNIPCEFPDNNECFITDNYRQIYNLEQNEEYNLLGKNLIKWNYPNYENMSKLCNPNLKFHIFALGYISFNEKNLKEFENEFPFEDLTNNPLYKAYKIYKSPKNIDRFFSIISVVLLCWSFFHFIIQILLYINKIIRSIYIINGIILLFFKLCAYFGMIIHYFYFLNNVQKINVNMIDKPREELLNYYYISRNKYILKIISISVICFMIISVDFIIYLFTYFVNWGKEKDEEEPIINKEIIIKENEKNPISIKDKELKIPNGIELNEKEISINDKALISGSIFKTSNETVLTDQNKISLKFICKDNINKSYVVITDKDNSFNNVVKNLKENNPELNKIDMKVFITCDSHIINKTKTINENDISNNNNIIYIQT